MSDNQNIAEEKMTTEDARKLISVVDSCCKISLFTKREVIQIVAICLQAIDRAEEEMQNERF